MRTLATRSVDVMVRGLIVVVVAFAVAVPGCGSEGRSSTTATSTNARPSQPYTLLTHCGIEWAPINGTFWHAEHPLSDGSGNPPPGWGNPDQPGTLTFLTPTTARFDSPAGSVTFRRTARKEPPQICS
jgi:hypothetical protein